MRIGTVLKFSMSSAEPTFAIASINKTYRQMSELLTKPSCPKSANTPRLCTAQFIFLQLAKSR